MEIKFYETESNLNALQKFCSYTDYLPIIVVSN